MNHIEKFAEVMNKRLRYWNITYFDDDEVVRFIEHALDQSGLMLVPKSDSEWENQNNA